ncbi:MAG: DUF6491 family protein [Caulobacteraceae bacterium]
MRAHLLLAAVAALGLASAAHADAPAAKPKSSCFFTRNWDGWRSPDEKTIYLRVGLRDIYKVDLASGSSLLTWPDSHLINEVRGTDSVCSPIDLDLKVANDHFVEPLFIKAITKLTPEEVAAIPKKFLP